VLLQQSAGSQWILWPQESFLFIVDDVNAWLELGGQECPGQFEPVEIIGIIRMIKIIAIMNDFNQCKPEILLYWVFILACGFMLFKNSFTTGTPARACASARGGARALVHTSEGVWAPVLCAGVGCVVAATMSARARAGSGEGERRRNDTRAEGFVGPGGRGGGVMAASRALGLT